MPLPSARWSPVPLLLRHATGHSRGTDSRHQAARGGHRRTSRSGNLSSGGHLGSRRDTGGHATNTVRDREAPGSNPGPPTKNRIQNRHFAGFAYPAVSPGRSQIFSELGGGSPRSSGLRASIELAHGYRTADIPARARPPDREAPASKSQAGTPEDAQRRTVRPQAIVPSPSFDPRPGPVFECEPVLSRRLVRWDRSSTRQTPPETVWPSLSGPKDPCRDECAPIRCL